MQNNITPLIAIVTPDNIKPGAYDIVKSYSEPAIGGPINDAMPWNNSSSPKAFVNFSSPSKSTKITDVRPT